MQRDESNLTLYSGAAKDYGDGGESPTNDLQGFTRGDATGDVDGAEVDDGIIDDGDEEMKSEEPEDGESLDQNIDE